MPSLLLIEDRDEIHALLRAEFASEATQVHSAYTAAQGVAQFRTIQPDVVVLDVGLPDDSGLNVFRRIHDLDARVPVIFLTGGSTTETAIEAMSLGAYEYQLKPFEPGALRHVVAAAFEASRLARHAPQTLEEADSAGDGDLLIGRCPGMHEVYKHIGRVAKQDVTVLITGESGTGKELVARSIYQHSLRAKKPFLAINCAAIPEALLESELFGHEQGAFTGAAQCRIGKFEQCNGGTLFLDEVGDMTPVTQAKVLRVLQEQQFERVGGNKTIQTDVRILAATNRNLPERVKSGQYREDLYYRLNVYSIAVPPLRERGDDVALLVEVLVKRFAIAMGKSVTSVAPAAMQALRRHPWPGNVRELQSVVKYAIVQATSAVIVPESLPASVFQTAKDQPIAADGGNWETVIQALIEAAPADLYKEWLARTDTILLNHILKFTNGNLVQASKILGINRGTLRTKIRALNISSESFRADDDDAETPDEV